MGDDVPLMKDYETFEAPNVIVDGKSLNQTLTLNLPLLCSPIIGRYGDI